ncbi:MAG: right-handed parallel beta-helix repeat-containing protein [Pseudomonadota bacterium]
MSVVNANPFNITKRARNLRAGDRLVVKQGKYDRPLVLTGIAGTAEKPIVIEAEKGAVFTSGITLKKHNKRANLIAMRREAAGNYPSVGQTADEAMLAFLHCRHIVLRGITFKRCWPTAVYLEECQHMTLEHLKIREGTIAIGANGTTTRDITISKCDWRQDVSPDNRLWNSIPWKAVHGSRDTSGERVDPKADFRALDGDFFRGWDIAGNIVIRNNRISDAFNAIHVFNRVDRLGEDVDPKTLRFNAGRRSSANILIENNMFVRIRDNAIEPEDHAWNWVVRHNQFNDCYRPFSLELQRAGWIYIYGNYGWVKNPPSLHTTDRGRTKSSQSKLGGLQKNEGNIYVFLNSWYYQTGKGIFPKGAIGRLRHYNNAIGFGSPEQARMFGETDALPVALNSGASAHTADSLERHFTRQWDSDQFDIIFDGDIAQDENFPERFREIGFDLGAASKGGAPGFADTDADIPDLTVNPSSPAHASAIAMTLDLPDGTTHKIPEGLNVGADQADGAYDDIDALFGFLPEAVSIPQAEEEPPLNEQPDQPEQKKSLLLF